MGDNRGSENHAQSATKEDAPRTLLPLFQRHPLSKGAAQTIDKVATGRISGCLVPLNPGTTVRRPISFLEQSLLPKLSSHDGDDVSLSYDESSTAQMTIFYAGTVHVYDNISADTFRAITRVAGPTTPADHPQAEWQSDPDSMLMANQTPKPNLLPNPKPQVVAHDLLPLAKRYSIKQFLEKRRHRLARQSPYNQHTESSGGREIGRTRFSPAPFPSVVGFGFFQSKLPSEKQTLNSNKGAQKLA